MDTSDPEITFDDFGVCNHCRSFDTHLNYDWFPNESGIILLNQYLDKIRASERKKRYDCIIGLSGGVDSSYLALKAKDWGLRPLVVHVDAGWNSELAVSNIQKVIEYCDYDLFTHVVDWEVMRDLHLSYLRSGIANQDVPQDHIFFASLYHFAIKHNIRYIFSGGNLATEGVFPSSWHGSAMDAINLKAIHRVHGSVSLKGYKTISFYQLYVLYPLLRRMRTVRPLNYMPYNKDSALRELETKIGFTPYARKHGESVFTKFFQNHYLPLRFGIDKRRAHLSSLIVSGQITRQEAIQKLAEPLYEPQELENDLNYFCKKLRISRNEFDELLKIPIRSYTDFPNWNTRYTNLKKAQRLLGQLMRRSFKVYS